MVGSSFDSSPHAAIVGRCLDLGGIFAKLEAAHSLVEDVLENRIASKKTDGTEKLILSRRWDTYSYLSILHLTIHHPSNIDDVVSQLLQQ